MALNCLAASDPDIRKELVGGIILTGGNSMFTGFPERLNKSIVTTNYLPKTKIIAHEPIERKFSSWIGGSILASLPSMSHLWVTKEEYEEKGFIVVDRKCP